MVLCPMELQASFDRCLADKHTLKGEGKSNADASTVGSHTSIGKDKPSWQGELLYSSRRKDLFPIRSVKKYSDRLASVRILSRFQARRGAILPEVADTKFIISRPAGLQFFQTSEIQNSSYAPRSIRALATRVGTCGTELNYNRFSV